MLMTTNTVQALSRRRHPIKNRKPAERIDGDRSNAAPSAVLVGRPVPVGR